MEARDRQIERVLVQILVLNIAVALAKAIYGALSGSLAVASDALHSLLDGASNVVGVIALRMAARPPDPEHPYGHAKVEIVAAALIGLFIAGGAMRYGYGATRALLEGRPAPVIGPEGIAILALTLCVNVFVAWWERARGRALSSTFLTADASHTASDVLVTVGVIASMVATYLGVQWADPAASIGVIGVIGFVGWRIISRNVDVLIDRAAIDPAEVTRVACGVDGVHGCHRVRSRGVGLQVHLDLHLLVDGAIPLRKAHALSHEVEERLRAQIPGLRDVTIHVEPSEDPEEIL